MRMCKLNYCNPWSKPSYIINHPYSPVLLSAHTKEDGKVRNIEKRFSMSIIIKKIMKLLKLWYEYYITL